MIEGLLSLEANDTIEFNNSMDNLFDLFNPTPKNIKIQTKFVNTELNLYEPKEAKQFCFKYQNVDYQNELL